MSDKKEKQVVLTLKRFYYKEVEIVVDKNLVKGKTDDEIFDFLIENQDADLEDELFQHAELEHLDILGAETVGAEDTNRFDIYEEGKHTTGGHL